MQKVIRPFLQERTKKVCITWEDTGRKSLVTIDELLQLPNERIHSAEGNLLPCTIWSQLFDDVTEENWTLANITKYMWHLQILKGMKQAHDAACSTCRKVDFGDSFLWLEMSYLKNGNAPPPSPAESFHSAQEEREEERDLCEVVESLMRRDSSEDEPHR